MSQIQISKFDRNEEKQHSSYRDILEIKLLFFKCAWSFLFQKILSTDVISFKSDWCFFRAWKQFMTLGTTEYITALCLTSLSSGNVWMKQQFSSLKILKFKYAPLKCCTGMLNNEGYH